MLLFVFDGLLLLRFAERQLLPLLFQLPPRFTRFEPLRPLPSRISDSEIGPTVRRTISAAKPWCSHAICGQSSSLCSERVCLPKCDLLEAVYRALHLAGVLVDRVALSSRRACVWRFRQYANSSCTFMPLVSS